MREVCTVTDRSVEYTDGQDNVPLDLGNNSLFGINVFLIISSRIINFNRIQHISEIFTHVWSAVVAIQPALFVFAKFPSLKH